MSSLLKLKYYVAVMICLSTIGCGFEPLYKRAHPEDAVAFPVKIETIEHSRLGQELKTQLETLMNPLSAALHPKYTLNVKIKQVLQPLVIERDRRISRYNLTLSSDYVLKEIATGAKISEGTSRVVGSYDAVETSDFSTYAAQKDTELRLAREAAKDIKLRLISVLRKSEEEKRASPKPTGAQIP